MLDYITETVGYINPFLLLSHEYRLVHFFNCVQASKPRQRCLVVGNAKPSELVSYMCRAINSGSRLLIGIEKKEDKWHEKVQLGGSKV